MILCILCGTNVMVKQLKIFSSVPQMGDREKKASKVEVVVITYQVINVILIHTYTHALYGHL